MLFDVFYHLLGFLMSRCAFDASETQTALVYAISGPPFETFGEPMSSKLALEILDPSAI